MMRSSVILALGIAVSLFGCNNDDVVAPIADGALNSLAKNQPIGAKEVFKLDGALREPGGFNGFVGIQGELEVVTSLHEEGPARLFVVTSRAYADLFPLDIGDAAKKMFIAGSSKELVAVKNLATLERTYVVEGGDDGLTLHISLQINRNGGVRFLGMKLSKKVAIVRSDNDY